MNPDLFYAYIYYDPSRDNEPIYVGKGRKNILAGAKHRAPVTEEAKKNRSAGRTGLHYPVIECPHCGKRGGSATMPRWHFDRCKFKGNKEND